MSTTVALFKDEMIDLTWLHWRNDSLEKRPCLIHGANGFQWKTAFSPS
jgi:hypothetical protein